MIKKEMKAHDVIEFLQLCEENGIEIIVDGGWGVDALLGKQTRIHEDLDIALQHKFVPKLRQLLEAKGYKDIPRDDTKEYNFVMGDNKGHEIDFHSYTFDAEGNNIFGVKYPFESLTGAGKINGHQVKCISPAWMVKFHTGYKPDENDYHDVLALGERFEIPLPPEYEKFPRTPINKQKENGMKNHRAASTLFAGFLKQRENDISCTELTGGSEQGTIFKCSYQNADYVIKLFTNKELGKNEIAWTSHASNLGIGPHFFYADPDGYYMITAFAKGNSLVPDTVNSSPIIKHIAINLAKLHNSSAPFSHTQDIIARIDAKHKKLQCPGKLRDILEHGWQKIHIIEAQIKNFGFLLAPCHNDLNWGNIFADNNQVTVIDWGDAAISNPYFDIAAFFVLNNVQAENEKLFFENYDPQLLSSQWQTYMKLLKKLVYFEFALNLLLGVQTGKKELLLEQGIPEVKQLNHYLNLLAKKEVKVDDEFLYEMAIASLALVA